MKKGIDNVTPDILQLALRASGIEVDLKTTDRVIDLVELIEEHGVNTNLEHLASLQGEWMRLEQYNKQTTSSSSKGTSLFRILEDVALERIRAHDECNVIRISHVFMQQLIIEFSKRMNLDAKTSGFTLEFDAIFHGKKFRIEHRIYKDDSNDPDVDREILKRLL